MFNSWQDALIALALAIIATIATKVLLGRKKKPESLDRFPKIAPLSELEQETIAKLERIREQTFNALKKKQQQSSEQDHVFERVPFGNRVVKKWPVLDLGVHPDLPIENWQFEISGVQADTGTICVSLNYLKQVLGTQKVTCDLHCVTTWSVLDLQYEGICFHKFVDLVKPIPDWKYLIQHGADGYTVNVSREDLEQDKSRHVIALIATHYNGEPLSRERGLVRMVVPHLFGWKGAKFLVGLEFVTEKDNKPGFWEMRGSHERGRVALNERWQIKSSSNNSDEDEQAIETRVLKSIDENYNGSELNLKEMQLHVLLPKIVQTIFSDVCSNVSILLLDNNNLTGDLSEYPWKQLKCLKRISLNNNKLTGISKEFAEGLSEAQCQLEEIFVVHNKITHVAPEIALLKNSLVTLWLDDNELNYLPDSICELEQLLSLTLVNNKLTSIPNNMGNLSKLKCLTLSGNPTLKTIPTSIGNLDSLDFLGVDDGLEGLDSSVVDEGTNAIKQQLKKMHRASKII